MASTGWTIGELAARVAAALDDGYPGAPNGRVRNLPDARAIRWYATIGLVDRPSAMRGRTALYGPRHLLQLVAIKRRQAQGRTIAEIQEELAGAGETTLRTIAEVPDALLSPDVEPAATPPNHPPDAPADRSARFWAERPAEATGPPPRAPAPARPGAAAADTAAAPEPAGAQVEPAAATVPPLLTGIPLVGGAVLLVPATPDHDDLTAIAVAARPLLDLLSARGLLRSES
jgi:DNA-binding transcriptional MerR regulator